MKIKTNLRYNDKPFTVARAIHVARSHITNMWFRDVEERMMMFLSPRTYVDVFGGQLAEKLSTVSSVRLEIEFSVWNRFDR